MCSALPIPCPAAARAGGGGGTLRCPFGALIGMACGAVLPGWHLGRLAWRPWPCRLGGGAVRPVPAAAGRLGHLICSVPSRWRGRAGGGPACWPPRPGSNPCAGGWAGAAVLAGLHSFRSTCWAGSAASITGGFTMNNPFDPHPTPGERRSGRARRLKIAHQTCSSPCSAGCWGASAWCCTSSRWCRGQLPAAPTPTSPTDSR